MAYCKVSASHKCIAAMRYGEHETDCIHHGIECSDDTETAIKQMKADRLMWNKDSGVEAHVIIQSFQGMECDAKTANEIGQELAARIAPGHRAMVYTHTESEGGNIHNHIVINSVNYENGKKLRSGWLLHNSREISNELTKERGLSVINERGAEMRYTRTEAGLVAKGKESWKQNIRSAVAGASAKAHDFTEFEKALGESGISIIDHGEGRKYRLTYVDADGHKARGAKLGDAYEYGGVMNEIGKTVERDRNAERVQAVAVNARASGRTGRSSSVDKFIEETDRRIDAIRAERLAAERRKLEAQKRALAEQAKLRELQKRNEREHERDYGYSR